MCFLFHDCSIDRNNANFFGKLSIDNKEQDYYLALERDLTLYDDVPLQVFETAAIHFEKSPSFGWCEHRRERGGNGSSNTANSLRLGLGSMVGKGMRCQKRGKEPISKGFQFVFNSTHILASIVINLSSK